MTDLPSLPLSPDAARSRHAYAFYATDPAYAAAVLVFIQKLRALGVAPDIALVVLHRPLPARLTRALAALGATLIAVSDTPRLAHRYYRHCRLKLRVFQLHAFERVIFCDADSLPLRPLDPLFALPFEGALAAPAAYWLPTPLYSTSALLVLKPTPEN